MIEEVEMYRTSDSTLHKSQQDAEEYELNQFRQIIDDKFQLLVEAGFLKSRLEYSLILKMFPTYKSAIEFLQKIKCILE